MSRLLDFARVTKNKWSKILDKSVETPVFAFAGGVIGGVTGISNMNNGNLEDIIAAGVVGTFGGICLGYISAPAFLISIPVLVPVGIYGALFSTKHKVNLHFCKSAQNTKLTES